MVAANIVRIEILHENIPGGGSLCSIPIIAFIGKIKPSHYIHRLNSDGVNSNLTATTAQRSIKPTARQGDIVNIRKISAIE